MLDSAKSLFVFPTSRSIRGYTNNLKETNKFIPKLITIGDFFQRVLYVPNKSIISKELKFIYLQQAALQCNIEALGLSSDFSSFFKQSDYIQRLFNELASEYKTIDDLQDVDTYALYLDHLTILKDIQHNFYKILNDNSYVDQSLLPSQSIVNESYIKQYEKIEIFYDGYFSKYEFQALKDISKLVNVIIHCNINKYNQKNIKMFNEVDISLQINQYYQIDLTNNEIKYQQDLINKNENIKIFPISQRITQIGFIKYTIFEMVSKYNISPEKIAVILPDEQFHTSLALFNDEKYFNFAMGNAIENSNIKKVVSSINKIIVNFEPKDKDKLDLFNIDKTLLETIKIHWNKKISKTLFFEMCEKLFLYEINEDILDKLHEIQLSLEILLYTYDKSISYIKLSEIFKILQQKLNEITLDDVAGGKITVMGLLETRGLNFEHGINFDGVIVCDFNDELVPKRSVKDKFISSSVKQLIDLPTNEDRQNLQRYYYKNLFDQAKYVALSFVEDEANTKSRFVTDIFPNIKIEDNNFDFIFNNILYKDNLLKQDEIDIVIDIDLSKLSWSASSLKVLLDCKRKYYLQYILKLKEHLVSLKPNSYELGQIVHKVIEKLNLTNSITIKALEDELSKYQKTTELIEVNPYLVLDIEIWKRKLKKFVKNENKRRDEGIQIIQTEKEFNLIYKGIKLNGKIDAIAQTSDGKIEILDYKTSSALKVDTLKTYVNSTDFQLEFYYLANHDKDIQTVGYYDLNDGVIKEEVALEQKLELLDEILEQLHTTKVNFVKCEELTKCQFCPYKLMCNRDL